MRGMKKIMGKAKKWKKWEFLGEVLDWIIDLPEHRWFQALVAIVLAIVSSLVGLALWIWLFVQIFSMLHM